MVSGQESGSQNSSQLEKLDCTDMYFKTIDFRIKICLCPVNKRRKARSLCEVFPEVRFQLRNVELGR